MKYQRNNLCFIKEPLLESDIQIAKENPDNTLSFRAIMQLTDIMNANRRIYPTELVSRHIELVQPMISKKRLFGEADHPDADAPPHRIMSVRIKDSSHVFHSLWVDKHSDKGIVRAVCETTPTTWGYTLASFIRRGYGVGFSLRSIGRVIDRGGNTSVISEPFKFVTYDAVFNPSNEAAFVEEVLTEAANCVKEQYLAESKQLNPLIERYIEAEVRECAARMMMLF
jgi:hypothetical protein